MRTTAREAGVLRVMTFNVLFGTARNPAGSWRERRPLVAEVIRRWSPDVLGLQEVMDQPLRELQADLPEYGFVVGARTGYSKWPYWALTLTPALLAASVALNRRRVRGAVSGWPWVSPALLGAAAVPILGTTATVALSGSATWRAEFCPVLYRRDRYRVAEHSSVWLSEPPDDPLTLLMGTWLPRAANRVHLEPLAGDSPPLYVYNTHLDYMSLGSESSTEALCRQLEKDWDGSPQFLMGDLNGGMDSRECRYLTRDESADGGPPPLRSAWEAADTRQGPDGTCHHGLGTAGPAPRWTDHILYRPLLRVARAVTEDHHRDGVYPSDHFPVVADFC